MVTYILKRIVLMIPTLILISIISFTIIQLPPGDYLTTYIANLAQTGEDADEALVASLRARYGLDQPLPMQYLKWMSGVLRGDFGQSFSMNKPVRELIWERLGLTFIIALLSILLTYMIAIPIGIYSATHQYKASDYGITILGFIGMATPQFSLALLVMYFSSEVLGVSVGG
ncbi:MAG TPA: ABC transporter permease, partial [bacterium]|nr:ABC transporter permease [bacterium]